MGTFTLNPAAGSTSLTPWTSDIDADGWNLLNAYQINASVFASQNGGASLAEDNSGSWDLQNILTINSNRGQIIDAANSLLLDSSLQNSLDWEGRELIDISGTPALDWGTLGSLNTQNDISLGNNMYFGSPTSTFSFQVNTDGFNNGIQFLDVINNTSGNVYITSRADWTAPQSGDVLGTPDGTNWYSSPSSDISDGTYTLGAPLTLTGTTGTITFVNGRITALQEAT